MNKSKAKPLIVVAVVLSVAITTYFVLNIVFSPYWDSVYPPTGYFSPASFREAESDTQSFTKNEACEDIDYIVARLKRTHPACIDGVPENVTAAAEREKAAFEENVSVYDIWRAGARVLHEMNDSHCMIVPSFPMNYITANTKMIESGWELESVNGASIEDIFKAKSDLFSYELNAWGVNMVGGYLGTREGLKFLGLYSDKLEYTYSMPDGSKTSVTYTQNDFYNNQAANGETEESPDVPYSSYILKEKNAAVLTFTSCVYDMDLKQFLYDFFTEVCGNDIGNIVIDLRDNPGGTSEVLDQILVYVDREKFKTPGGEWRLGPYMMRWESEESKIINMDVETLFSGDIYVLTSSGTFSSATLIAETLQDNGFAKVVGEPCGNMPEGYGEVVAFQTPNSILTFQLSSKHFERIDESKAELPLTPDFECDARMAMLEVMDIIANK